MSWACGFDPRWQRDIGYGVPASCDLPGCGKEIDRGLAYVCGGEPRGGDYGCGLYLCEGHLMYGEGEYPLCPRCLAGSPPFEPTPDVPRWLEWKLTDSSWQRWRDEHPVEVDAARLVLASASSGDYEQKENDRG